VIYNEKKREKRKKSDASLFVVTVSTYNGNVRNKD
jgi:hypothetical protein